MQTPWGDIELWDAHAHLFSGKFFRTLHSQRSDTDQTVEEMVAELGWEAPGSNADLAERWAAELESAGVERSVLMASVPDDEDSIGEVVAARPDRFLGYFMFNPVASDAGVRVCRAFDELSLQGLCLFPAMGRFSVRDDALKPLYRAAAEGPGRVVFVHMGVLTVGVRKKLGLPSIFDMTYSNPLDLHRVALEYPEVQFVLPHFGAGFFREALMLCDLCPNVSLDTSSSNSWTKYLTPQPDLREVFRQALNVCGPERLLFGSDSSFFPRGWNRAVFEAQAQALKAIGASRQDAEAIFGGNLRRLMKSERG